MRRLLVAFAILGLTAISLGQTLNPNPQNMLKNPFFETTVLEWRVDGAGTTIGIDPNVTHEGKRSLYIAAKGPRGGQAETIMFPAVPGRYYYAEGWFKADPKLPNTVAFDMEFFNRRGECLIDSVQGAVGRTDSTEWVKLSGTVTAPDGTASVRLRVEPGCSAPEKHGAVWLTAMVLREAQTAVEGLSTVTKAVTDDPPGTILLDGPPGGHSPRPALSALRPPDLRETWFPQPAQVTFEDMAGWKVVCVGVGEMDFYRTHKVPLEHDVTGRLVYRNTNAQSRLTLVPPSPIVLPPCDTTVIWVHGNSGWDPLLPSVSLILEDGKGAQHIVTFQNLRFMSWVPVMARIDPALPRPLRLAGIEFKGINAEIAGTEGAKPSKPSETRWLAFDHLAFYVEDKSPIELSLPTGLPFPTRPETILPSVNDKVDNEVARNGDAYVFISKFAGGKTSYTYTPKSGSLDDMTFADESGKSFPVAKGGGPVFEVDGKIIPFSDPAVKKALLSASKEGSTVVARWEFSVAGVSATLKYSLQVMGKSLVVTVECDRPVVSVFKMGAPDRKDISPLAVPYLFYRGPSNVNEPCVRYTKSGWFISNLWDYYNSEATSLAESEAEYRTDTAGNRHPMKDRIFITCSKDFDEVLPTIPNPPSPWRAICGKYVFSNLQGWDHAGYQKYLMLLRRMKRYGMDYMLFMQFEIFSEFQNRGYQSDLQTTRVNETIPGGEKAVLSYFEQLKGLGYLLAIDTAYDMMQSVNADFDERYVSRKRDNLPWRWGLNYFFVTPLKMSDLAAEWGAKLKAKFGVDADYADTLTAQVPWYSVDYDARKPWAAQLKAAFYGIGRSALADRAATQGPVYAEGTGHWFWAGLVDGNFGTLNMAGGDYGALNMAAGGDLLGKVPFLVDFDLLKMHPLEFDLSMTHLAFDDRDRLLCTMIAYGHYGMFEDIEGDPVVVPPENPLGRRREGVLKQYFMIQQLQTCYAQEPVKSIRYFDGAQFLDTSRAILNGAYKRKQLRVEYQNGLTVFANGNLSEPWEVEVGSEKYVLPPSGYAAFLPGRLLEYSALRGDGRVDFVDSPEYIYADGRGHETDFGPVKTAGITILRKLKAGEIEAIPVGEGAVIALRPDKLGWPGRGEIRVVALDVVGNEIGSKSLPSAGGWLPLKAEGNIFSFRITR